MCAPVWRSGHCFPGGSGIDTYNTHHPAQMPTALEAGTLNGHGIAGLGAAVSYITETGPDTIRERELALMQRFYLGIFRDPGCKGVRGFQHKEPCSDRFF